MKKQAKLVLENGDVFSGWAIGDLNQLNNTAAEIVFNTGMTGYQEILTDPSYAQQIVLLTYPHIGNVGTNDDDDEAKKIFAKGLIIRELPITCKHWRKQQDLTSFLKQHNTIALAGIDTRALTNTLREKGSLKGAIVSDEMDTKTAIKKAQKSKDLTQLDLAKVVTSKKSYHFSEASLDITNNARQAPKTKYRVAVYDFGVKRHILNLLVDNQCQLTVFPATTPASEVLAIKPDGVFLSNGPGDPEPCQYAIDAIKTLLAKNVPLFGICLGHQLLSLACGARTVKMKFGHHGINHPVQDLNSKQVFITSQNHSFSVCDEKRPKSLIVTHRSLFDQSIQGVRVKDKPAFGFQGHPEASPGPKDVRHLFNQFIQLMQ